MFIVIYIYILNKCSYWHMPNICWTCYNMRHLIAQNVTDISLWINVSSELWTMVVSKYTRCGSIIIWVNLYISYMCLRGNVCHIRIHIHIKEKKTNKQTNIDQYLKTIDNQLFLHNALKLWTCQIPVHEKIIYDE